MAISHALVVDDSKSARFSLKKLLQKINIQVEFAASAEDALMYLDSKLPDIIFMDHLMPGMDGFEATQAIKSKEEWQHIPVVMCTSKEGQEYRDMAHQLGVIGILPKPASMKEVNDVLAKVGGVSEPALAADNVELAPSKVKEIAIDVVRSVTMDTIENAIESKLRAHTLKIFEQNKQLTQDLLDQQIETTRQEISHQALERTQIYVEEASGKIINHIIDDILEAQFNDLSNQIMQQVNNQFMELKSEIETLRTPDTDQLEEVKNIAKFVAAHKASEAAEQTARDIATEAAATAAEEKAQEALMPALDAFQTSLQSSLNKLWFFSLLAAGLGLTAIGLSLFF